MLIQDKFVLVIKFQELEAQGELHRTERLILEIYHLESFIFSARLPRRLGDILKASVSVLYPTKHGREGYV